MRPNPTNFVGYGTCGQAALLQKKCSKGASKRDGQTIHQRTTFDDIDRGTIFQKTTSSLSHHRFSSYTGCDNRFDTPSTT